MQRVGPTSCPTREGVNPGGDQGRHPVQTPAPATAARHLEPTAHPPRQPLHGAAADRPAGEAGRSSPADRCAWRSRRSGRRSPPVRPPPRPCVGVAPTWSSSPGQPSAGSARRPQSVHSAAASVPSPCRAAAAAAMCCEAWKCPAPARRREPRPPRPPQIHSTPRRRGPAAARPGRSPAPSTRPPPRRERLAVGQGGVGGDRRGGGQLAGRPPSGVAGSPAGRLR